MELAMGKVIIARLRLRTTPTDYAEASGFHILESGDHLGAVPEGTKPDGASDGTPFDPAQGRLLVPSANNAARIFSRFFMGRATGLEPATLRTTT